MKDLELIVPEKLDVERVFVKGDTDEILERITATARSIVRDITTDEGRKNVASVAHKISRSKVLLDNMGKEYVRDIKKKVKVVDSNRKKIRDTLDTLRDDYRAPLTEWEEAEKRRQEEEARRAREKTNQRIAEILKYAPETPVIEIATMTDEEYAIALNKAKLAHQAELDRLESEKIAEAKRKAAEEKTMAEQRAEIERVKKEQEAQEALIAAEREKIEAEKREIELEKAAREEREKAELNRIAAAERVVKEKADAMRQEMLKPDKEKLIALADFLENGIEYPKVKSAEAANLLENVSTQIYLIATGLVKDAKDL